MIRDTIAQVSGQVGTVAQGGMAIHNVIENPTVQNAIIQMVIVILTAILGNIGKKRAT